MTIEQLTIIFIEQRVFPIPFENSDNLERSLVPQGKSHAFTHSRIQKFYILRQMRVLKS